MPRKIGTVTDLINDTGSRYDLNAPLCGFFQIPHAEQVLKEALLPAIPAAEADPGRKGGEALEPVLTVSKGTAVTRLRQ